MASPTKRTDMPVKSPRRRKMSFGSGNNNVTGDKNAGTKRKVPKLNFASASSVTEKHVRFVPVQEVATQEPAPQIEENRSLFSPLLTKPPSHGYNTRHKKRLQLLVEEQSVSITMDIDTPAGHYHESTVSYTKTVTELVELDLSDLLSPELQTS